MYFRLSRCGISRLSQLMTEMKLRVFVPDLTAGCWARSCSGVREHHSPASVQAAAAPAPAAAAWQRASARSISRWWMDGWMDGWMEGWMDGWMEGAGLLSLTLTVCSECVHRAASPDTLWSTLSARVRARALNCIKWSLLLLFLLLLLLLLLLSGGKQRGLRQMPPAAGADVTPLSGPVGAAHFTRISQLTMSVWLRASVWVFVVGRQYK